MNLAKAVAATGRYEVEIVAYGDSPSKEGRQVAAGVTFSALPRAGRREGTEPLSWDIIGLIRDADVVHIHDPFARPSEVALLAAKLFAKPVCTTDHGRETSRLGKSLGMLDLVDRILCYSQFGRSLLGSEVDATVILGGVDDDFFVPAGPIGRDRLVYVGALLPYKGVDQLLAALPDDLPLSVCGLPCHGQYYQLLRGLASGKEVEFIPGASDEVLRDLYRRALAVVDPSVYVDRYGVPHVAPELMGLSLLEGMACGAPAICSRVGALPEYVDHDETGFIYDEAGELIEYIRRLAGQPELVEAMGANGRVRVATDYGLATAGRTMAAVYDDLLDDAARR